SVTKINNIVNTGSTTLATQYGGAFCFISGMMVDTSDLANETLYIGTDCTQAGINGAGAIYQVKPAAPTPGPPVAPINVAAVNATPPGAAIGSATVSWTPQFNGQPITSYVVHTVLASDGTTAAP